MKERSLNLRHAVIAALAMSAMPALPVAAQNAAATEENSRTIENIIVTAQKREQSLQDVPIVVTAVSEQLLKDTGVKDIKDLTLLTPGLIVTSTSNETVTTARIRGVGTVGDNPGLESSVGVVIDGVYRPRNGVSFGDLGELERIEVLKGPQGTLFGKNTSAGVINVVSKRPSFEFGSDIELTAGNYGAMEGAASITGPFSKTLAGRLYVAARERDGLLDVQRGNGPRTEDEDGNRKFYTVRGQLLLQPSDALDIRLTGDYSDRDEECCAAPQKVTGATGPLVDALAPDSGLLRPADPFRRDAFSNRSTGQEITDEGASAEINWDLSGGPTLTSITAWRNWESINGQDSDFTTADILYRDENGLFANEFGQLSQELRIAGESERLNWLFGAFYAQEDLDSTNQLIYGTQFRPYFAGLAGAALAPIFAALPASAYPSGLGTRDTYDQESKSWALFTNNSVRITEGLELTLGLRYTSESKDLDSQYRNDHGGVGCSVLRGIPPLVNNPGAAGVFSIGCATFADPVFNNFDSSQSLDENEWSGTAKLAYRFTDTVMAYASYARGYKAGGFNLDRERIGNPALAPNPANPAAIRVDADTSFEKELVDSYEVGMKTQWLDDSLLLNASVFFQEFTDFQLNTFTGISFIVASIPEVTSEGVDLDFVWFTPLEQLSLQGGVTYAETEYGNFVPGPGVSPRLPNNQMSFAPEWSGSLSATFEQPIGASMVWRTNVGAKYTSEYNTGSDLAPQKLQESLTLVNARTGFGAADERWMIEAWAQNLTDEEYYQVVFDATLQPGTFDAFLGAPRTYGLTARFKF